MKILFAVNSENVSDEIIKKYQRDYREIISYKNVYYFDAIQKEIQQDKSYDRIVISEDLEPFSNSNYETMDKFIFEKLDGISDESNDFDESKNTIILICSDRHSKGSSFLVKLFGLGIYNALIGGDRNIEEVCRLIKKPRTKKDAKTYYQINVNEVGYKAVKENEVSETEIQNIISHFKKLGKNQVKYASSFDKIASQYNENQLKIIINCLPLKVKSVLEECSTKYQEIMAMDGKIVKGIKSSVGKTQSAEKRTGIKIDIIENKMRENKITKPIVIPNTIKSSQEKKVVKVEPSDIEEIQNTEIDEPIRKKVQVESSKKSSLSGMSLEEKRRRLLIKKKRALMKKRAEENAKLQKQNQILEEKEKEEEVEIKSIVNSDAENTSRKKRGRPRKETIDGENKEKGKRGRPRKSIVEEKNEELDNFEFDVKSDVIEKNNKRAESIKGFRMEEMDDIEETNDSFDVIDDIKDYDDFNNKDVLKNKVNENDEIVLNELEFNEEGEIIDNADSKDDFQNEESINLSSNIDDSIDFEEQLNELDDLDTLDDFDDTENVVENNQEIITDKTSIKSIDPVINYSMSNLNSLITKDKKIVAFVGTSKNGVSFLVNNLAKLFSTNKIDINTAILDMTKNKNSYYIYTDNQEKLRKIAYSSLTNLQNGVAEGIKVNPNMTVYTALPNDGNDYSNAESILSTLVQKHSLILIDCDFDTDASYFANAQEIYLVQSMDVLTIQPLTSFLRELLHKGVLEQEKIKIVINKELKVRDLNSRRIITGMSVYNDSSMSVLTELFNRETVKYCSIPFEEDIYAKYLYELAECKFSLKGYSKNFLNKLRILADMVYPLTSRQIYSTNGSNSYGSAKFSENTNDILNKMKKKY